MNNTSHSCRRIGGWLFLAGAVVLTAACTPAAWRKSTATPLPTLTPTTASEIVAYATAQPTPTIRRATPTRTPSTSLTPSAAAVTATPTIPPRPENENPLTGLTVEDPALLGHRPLHIRLGRRGG
jgi:hypothetical protein